MSNVPCDVLGIGNAIVDLIAAAEDDFLIQHQLVKGSMMLTDQAKADALYAAMGPATVLSGGSGANTMAGLASFGGDAIFVGKVRDDALGKSFTHDIRTAGVVYTTPPATDGPATARSFILVTPDGERTMNTFLGACHNLTLDDIDEAQVAAAKIIYMEGYLWDPPQAKLAFRKAADIAKRKGVRTALTLSDTFCVDSYRNEFLELMRTGVVDIVFANEGEVKALYQTADFSAALQALRDDVPLAAVTRSEKGCIVVQGSERVEVAAQPVERVVDSTGAGDMFAAGFLYGLTRNLPLARCGELGCAAAGHIIGQIGARPHIRLSSLTRNGV